jgi:hypothetical protein
LLHKKVELIDAIDQAIRRLHQRRLSSTHHFRTSKQGQRSKDVGAMNDLVAHPDGDPPWPADDEGNAK